MARDDQYPAERHVVRGWFGDISFAWPHVRLAAIAAVTVSTMLTIETKGAMSSRPLRAATVRFATRTLPRVSPHTTIGAVSATVFGSRCDAPLTNISCPWDPKSLCDAQSGMGPPYWPGTPDGGIGERADLCQGADVNRGLSALVLWSGGHATGLTDPSHASSTVDGEPVPTCPLPPHVPVRKPRTAWPNPPERALG